MVMIDLYYLLIDYYISQQKNLHTYNMRLITAPDDDDGDGDDDDSGE
jgi:hypothetical protein